jgi:hypothetical protein
MALLYLPADVLGILHAMFPQDQSAGAIGMTLKERLLHTLEQERKAIDAAIFIIQSSNTLDGIELEAEAQQRAPQKKRTAAPMVKATRPTRPVPTSDKDDTDDDLDDWGDPAPKIACETCDEKFADAKSLGIHKTRVHFGRGQ